MPMLWELKSGEDTMSVIRVRKDANYFAASNEPFNDIRLSWETRGLMGYLLSKPDHWEINVEDLVKKGPAKEFKIRRMLAEARKCGYMNRIRVTNQNNTFDWITEIYESPSLNPNPSSRFSTTGASSRSSTCGKPRDIVSTDSDEKEIFQAVEQLLGCLTSDVTRYVDTWREKHSGEWILKALAIAKEKGARSLKYVDSILIGWEANGYPKTREQKVEAAKGGNGRKPVSVPEVKTIPPLDPEKVSKAKEDFHVKLSANR